jgi:hypothetical protein
MPTPHPPSRLHALIAALALTCAAPALRAQSTRDAGTTAEPIVINASVETLPSIRVTAPPALAAAPSAAQNDAVLARRLARTIRYYGNEAVAGRVWGGVGGVISGGTTIISGAVLASYNAPVWSEIGWIYVGLGAGYVVSSVFSFVFRSPFETMADDIVRWLGRERMAPAAVIRRVETRWQSLADAARRSRISSSVVGFVFGGLTAVATVVVPLALPAGLGLSSTDRWNIGAALGTSAASFLTGAIYSLAVESATEASLRLWRLGNDRPGASLARFGFGATALAGGGLFLGATARLD